MISRAMPWVMMVGALCSTPADSFGRDRKAPAPSTRVSRHWAFQPVRRPAVPRVRDAAWVRTPVDAFVLAQLEKKGLEPAPPANRRTLLRRVYLDLIGLPPTLGEQRAFLEDHSPDAYRKVVDDLLSRPEYGERWARHWLDVVRYAESNGYERDGTKPSAWRYRDYVIEALNRDKPYDRFLTEQLAGDEMTNANAETEIATTFLRLGTWDDEPADPLVDRYDQLDDVLGTTAAAFLGITLRCARCHDHKFEPFTQMDYYRMLAVFEPLRRPQSDRKDLDVPVGTKAELAAYQAAQEKVDKETARLEKQINGWKTAIRDRLFAKGNGKGTTIPPEAIAAFRTPAGKRNKEQKALAKKFGSRLDQEIRSAATREEKSQWADLEKQLASMQASRPKELPHAYIWRENGPKAPVTHVFRRGDPLKPKNVVEPGVPAVLVRQQLAPPKPMAQSAGRRLWLTSWMTRPDNPLVSRVMVNRVWQHHFGRGLVGSPNDFGVAGERPTHTQLLNWLAAEFVANGWHVKPLHRLIVLSNTYQMSDAFQPEAARIDSRNLYLWHWAERRLEAEAVRDSILAVSSRLNPQMAGPSIYPPLPRAVLAGQSRPGDGWGKSDERQADRHSVYIFVKRALGVPELELLDAPDTTSSCERRPISITGPQALTFLNGEFINQQARYFALRLVREAGRDAKAQVQRAFELALCRPARPEELRASLDFLTTQERQIEADARTATKKTTDARQQALAAFCLVIFNTNEFVYLN